MNLLGTSGAYGVIGACGALDQVLDETLGPDPLPCDQQTGPLAAGAGATSLPGATSPTAGTGSAAAPAGGAGSSSAATTTTTAPSNATGGLGGILGLGTLGGSTGSGSTGSGSTGASGGGLSTLVPSLLGGSS